MDGWCRGDRRRPRRRERLGRLRAPAAREALARDGFGGQEVDRAIAALEAIPAPQTIQERTAPAWEAVQAYGERAARGALQIAGLDAADVDCLITSHSTTPALPGLDLDAVQPAPAAQRHDAAAGHASGPASPGPGPWRWRPTWWPRTPTAWSWW